MKAETLLIRADASPQMGTGHVMRCLALAQVWQQARGRVVFALAPPAGPIGERVESEGFQVMELPCAPGTAEDANTVAALAHEREATSVVIDGYHFDAAYQRRIKDSGLHLLAMDDYGHAESYCADYVLNQSLDASPSWYARREAHTRLLLGARYILLRQEFLRWRGWQRRFTQPGRRILVTLGGSDPENVTLKIVEALARMDDCESVVVVGSNNPHWVALQEAASRHAPHFKLIRNTAEMSTLMAEADLAIASGGTTSLELAFMGLPAFLVTLADNQRGNVQQLVKIGAALPLDDQDIVASPTALLSDAAAREQMSCKGRALVDGDGSFRVWLRLMESSLQFRPAIEADCRQVWEWANDPDARKASFSSEPIPWETHVGWFTAKLREKGGRLWIACDRDGGPVGQVRFDGRDGRTIISINLGPDHRGRNLGSLIIWLACRKLFRESPVSAVEAWIKPDNTASVRAFQKAAFAQISTAVVNQQPALLFALSKERAEA